MPHGDWCSHKTSNKGQKVINLLHGVSFGYERLLKLETEIAITVLQQMKENAEFMSLQTLFVAMHQRRDSDDKT